MVDKKIFRAKKDIDFFIIDERIVLSDEYKKQIKPKKITGSRFGDLFTDSSSEIKTWMKIFSLYDEPFDEIYSKVGNEIENKLRNYYIELTKNKILNYIPKEVKWDIFKDNKIFGGIPDGEPLKDDESEIEFSKEKRMIEIKTASIDAFVFKKENGFFYMQKDDGFPIVKTPNAKLESWIVDNKIIIPNNYLFQLSLYMFLRNVEYGTFIIGFVPTYNYKFPEDFDVKNNLVKFVNYNLNLKEFNQYIDFAKNWWNTYIETGISPKLSKEDIEWFNEVYDND